MRKRPTPAHRKVPPTFATGAARRADAAEQTTGAYRPADRFYATIAEPGPHHAIEERDGQGAVIQVLHRYRLSWSELVDEVEQLNGRAPLASDVSFGILNSDTRKIKSDDPTTLSPTEWFERLYNDPSTAQQLREHASEDRSLPLDDLALMMAAVAPMAFDGDDDKTLTAVYKQVSAKLGIRRSSR